MAFSTKQHDTKPWVFTLKENGSGVDLTGASTVVIHMLDSALNSVINGGTVTPDADQTTYPGKCSYPPVAGDVDASGEFSAEFEVTWGDGTISTFPHDGYETITIHPDLG